MDVAVEVIRCGWKGKDDKRFPLSANFDKFKMLSANLGYVYENMVAQMLTAGGNKLFYHTQKYLLYTKDLQKDGNTLLLPLYMAPFI